MDDARWTWWILGTEGSLGDAVACAVVVGLLGMRVLPSTRRWAPRGNARRVRPGPAREVARRPVAGPSPARQR